MWSLLLCALLPVSLSSLLVPPSSQASAPYPEWAHSHQVWLSAGHSQSECLALVSDYLQRGIPVGGTNIDSEWATGFNDFVWRPDHFPDPRGMVDALHAQGVRVIAWATSMVDTNSPNFALAKKSGFLVSDAALVKWWHGEGGFLDFTFPAATAYWKGLMDNVLVRDSQLDGFKCDGTDPYIMELDLRGGAHGHDGRKISYREYADLYYEMFLNHSRSRNPYAIVWSRPVDSYFNYIYLDFSPRSVSFSGWVGDQDPTFDGLVDALNNILRSGWANYVSFGSDTGGYRGSDKKGRKRTRDVLLRWAQLNAFQGLFENGGQGEHRPWMFPEPNATTSVYRQYVEYHHALRTYLLGCGTEAWTSGTSIVRPVAKKPPLNWNPSTFAYFLGPSVFVDPVIRPNVTAWKVEFPAGRDYVDWFNKSQTYVGGSTTMYSVPLDSGRYPVFHVRGNLLPLNVRSARNADDFVPAEDAPLDLLLPCPRPGDAHAIVIRKYRQLSQDVSFSFGPDGAPLVFTASAHPRSLTLVMTGLVRQPVAVSALSGRAPSWQRRSDGSVAITVDCSRGEQLKISF